MAIEEPKFTPILKEGDFELRDYAPCIVAEVTVSGDQGTAARKGFQLLAAYIFGGNTSVRKIAMTTPVTRLPGGEKIAMTAPVNQISNDGERWRVRFTMPESYSLADLPRPNSPEIDLIALPAARYAVLRFSGLTGTARVNEKTARLRTIAASRGLVSIGPVSLARYDPPWVLPFLRRNEVMLPVAAA